jgi:hypothetical protein
MNRMVPSASRQPGVAFAHHLSHDVCNHACAHRTHHWTAIVSSALLSAPQQKTSFPSAFTLESPFPVTSQKYVYFPVGFRRIIWFSASVLENFLLPERFANKFSLLSNFLKVHGNKTARNSAEHNRRRQGKVK